MINTRTGAARPCGGPDTDRRLSLPMITDQSPTAYQLVLGHRRLAIIDLSPAGHQPMASTDGTCWLVYNGEIYNYIELREELLQRGHSFSSDSDTEVILAAYRQWGPDCVRRFVGMFAVALWDAIRRQLFCARGHFGIKPFYYHYDGRQFRFASEIKALLADPALPRHVNERMAFDYLADGKLDHTADTFFAGIQQLRPAQYLLLKLNDIEEHPPAQLTPRGYWDIQPDRCHPDWEDDQYARRLDHLLEDSVRLQLRADVPIGTCLSGGLDSSTIVCLTNRLLRNRGVNPTQIGERQKTFSACFEDRRFDERPYIEEVLRATGADGNPVFPDGQRLPEEIRRIVHHQDEPFASTSIYAQWNVFRRVAECGVKVMLDGQGGDEMLAGYPVYYPYYHLDLLARGRLGQFWREWRQYRAYHPHALGQPLRALFGIGTAAWLAEPKRRTKKLLDQTRTHLFPWLLPDLVDAYFAPEDWENRRFPDLLRERMYRELSDGLPSLLHYEDRNSMAFSVEARVPFLDHRLAEFCFALPSEQMIRHGLTKYVLRRAVADVLPAKVAGRTDKMGFVTPEIIWFQQTLADFTAETVASAPAAARAFFNLAEVNRMIAAAKQPNASKTTVNTLWRVLNFCLWWEVFDLQGTSQTAAATKTER